MPLDSASGNVFLKLHNPPIIRPNLLLRTNDDGRLEMTLKTSVASAGGRFPACSNGVQGLDIGIITVDQLRHPKHVRPVLQQPVG